LKSRSSIAIRYSCKVHGIKTGYFARDFVVIFVPIVVIFLAQRHQNGRCIKMHRRPYNYDKCASAERDPSLGKMSVRVKK
jgi:hypothetical protein